MIIVDTSVWSQAFRRSKAGTPTHPAVALLKELIEQEADLCVPGIVLQEVLSGVRHQAQFDRLRDVLHPFRVESANEEVHVRAAEVFNACKSAGVAATAIDCLIAATAERFHAKILAIDGDYLHIATVIPLEIVDRVTKPS